MSYSEIAVMETSVEMMEQLLIETEINEINPEVDENLIIDDVVWVDEDQTDDENIVIGECIVLD